MTTDTLESVLAILRKVAARYDKPLTERQRKKKDNPFKILVGVLLSSRTKDKTTGPAVERLFTRADTPEQMARLDAYEIERLIYPVGFYRTKAKHIKKLSRVISEEFSGRVPRTMEKLLELPGIGRKSANLILGVAFGIPAVCVDTHVHRIANRWGFVKTNTPAQTEIALRKKLPEKYWIDINRLLVIYGQNVCTPQSPFCSKCTIESFCEKIGVTRTR